MSANLQTLTLPDGRQMAYATFGDASGEPAFYCHGFPGSRLEAALLDDAARDLGVRVLAPDRPGYGGSDPSPDMGLADWPGDLRCLADALGIDEFLLIGVSGGAPFYRLRATGFADIDDARGFCAALRAAQGTCVPVLDG